MPSPIPENIVNDVKYLWASHLDWTAKSVWKEFKRARGGRQSIGLRKVQEIIAGAKRNSPNEPFPLVDWQPWQNSEETAEDANYLLELGVISLHSYGRCLYQHEARWARRIRVALQGLSLGAQCLMVLAYGDREIKAYNLKLSNLDTYELDSILATKPWTHPHWEESDPRSRGFDSVELQRDPTLYPEIPEKFIWQWFSENPEVNLPRIQEVLGFPPTWSVEILLAFDSKPNVEGAATPREYLRENQQRRNRNV